MKLQFLAANYLLLFWLLPALLVLLLIHQRRAAAKLRTLGTSTNGSRPGSRMTTLLKAGLLFAGLALVIIALARPAWQQKPTKVKREGRDVVFVLDVSRSMLAEDLSPNRLERAKLAINDCVEKLQGDRISLVVFAGSARVRCPLTLDYGFFRQILEQISSEDDVRSGTNIGDTLRLVQGEVFDNQVKAYKDIILISDGEDHDSFPVNAAEALGDEGIRLIVIGLGDDKQGQPIPLMDKQGRRRYLQYEGKQVLSRLNHEALSKIALASPGGRYLPVATGAIDLGQVYLDLIAGDAKLQFSEETIENYVEKFQYFLALALLSLVMEMLLTGKARKSMPR